MFVAEENVSIGTRMAAWGASVRRKMPGVFLAFGMVAASTPATMPAMATETSGTRYPVGLPKLAPMRVRGDDG